MAHTCGNCKLLRYSEHKDEYYCESEIVPHPKNEECLLQTENRQLREEHQRLEAENKRLREDADNYFSGKDGRHITHRKMCIMLLKEKRELAARMAKEHQQLRDAVGIAHATFLREDSSDIHGTHFQAEIEIMEKALEVDGD